MGRAPTDATLVLSGSGERPSRIRRLARIAAAVADIPGITHLHDAKGILLVKWESRPEPEQKAVVSAAWNFIGDEPSDNVEHEWPNMGPLDE